MSKLAQQPERTTDWADDDDTPTIPPPEVITNKDGTETRISHFINEQGQLVKKTLRIRRTVKRTVVNPRVAERRQWTKFGLEAGRPAGPQPDTTNVGENIVLRLQSGYKAGAAELAEKSDFEKKKATLKDAKIKCRICSGEHWTSKCPFKDTMAPEGEPGPGLATDDMGDMSGAAGSSTGPGGSYVPPHLRGAGKAGAGGAGAGERMGGKFERDDLATLRVTNLSEFADEQELREMFSRFGHVTRVFLAKDRETQRAKGFAFVSFADRSDAAIACDKMDGFGYGHLILRVEFAKKTT